VGAVVVFICRLLRLSLQTSFMFKVRTGNTASAGRRVASPAQGHPNVNSLPGAEIKSFVSDRGAGQAKPGRALKVLPPSLLAGLKPQPGRAFKGLPPGLLAGLQPQPGNKRKRSEADDFGVASSANFSIVARKSMDATDTRQPRLQPAILIAASSVRSNCFGASVAEEIVQEQSHGNACQAGVACVSWKQDAGSESHKRRRYNVQVKIEQALSKHVATRSQMQAPTLDRARLAAQIENALHKALVGDEKAYTIQARSILFNLNDSLNTDFRSMLAIGFIHPEEVPRLSPEQMSSYEKTVRRARVRMDGRAEVQTDWVAKHAPAHVDGVLMCDSCLGSKTMYFQLQTRRCDEAMTTYVRCLSCDARWKF